MASSTIGTKKSELDIFQLADKLYDEFCTCKSETVKQGPINVRSNRKDILVFDSRKYYDQAHNYHHAITLALENKPVAHFLISLSDLSLQLKSELNSTLDARAIESLLKQAVLRIFQDLDDDYNRVFPEDDPISKKFCINLCKENAKILKVKLVE
jgi:hypothetical protein